LTVAAIANGLSVPWDIAWLPNGTPLLTQRAGGLFVLRNGAASQLTGGGGDFWANGETGMMGLAVDPQYATNRRVYTCQGSTDNSPIGGHPNSVKVVAWQVDPAVTTATKLHEVVTGIDATSGRHGGCRLEFGSNRALWVTTGDAAFGTNPQNLSSLSGKVLRVNPDVPNTAWPGNPFPVFGAGSLVYTYGHRNVQGIAFRGDGTVWTAEHGPDRDDEVNLLRAGANYGWDPVGSGTYDESVPMTDPEIDGAVPAVWSSGDPTLATSGAAFLDGPSWGAYDGLLVVALLRDTGVLALRLGDDGTLQEQFRLAELEDLFGRLRSLTYGADGALYVTTSNGGDDKVLRVVP
jgi:glucose/arabinose dehydrogenase